MAPEPRATSWIHGDGTFGPHNRLRCACCGYATLDGSAVDLELVSWPQVCILCDWENAEPGGAVTADGDVSIEQAQRNFQRFNWMYDPGDLPPWLEQPPSRAELQARAALRDIYAEIDVEPDGPRFLDLWDMARDAEDTVRNIVDARVAGAVEQDDDTGDLEEYTP